MDQFGFDKKQTKNAVVYLRVSTEEQVDNYSLDTQAEICSREASKRGLTIIQTFREEGRSAKTITGRPVLIEMLEFCRKHKKEIEAIIIYRLDRISRQTADYLAIRKKLFECEIKLISATEPTGDSPTEKFVETMLAGFAQMDNDVRSERTKNGMKARFMSGLHSGYVPIGYLNQNSYTIKDSETFEAMREGWDIMATGDKTLREMVGILSAKGIYGGTKHGKRCVLRHQQLSRIFRNKFYAGYVVSKKYGREIRGQHPPMVSEEKFYRVQAILDGRNTNIALPLAKRNRDNPNFPLRRIVKCKHCGGSFTGANSHGHGGEYHYYFCQKRCEGENVSDKKLEAATKNTLNGIALKEKAVSLFNAFLRRKYYERIKTLQKRREEADTELKKLYEFRQALIEKNIAGIYSDEIFKEQNKLVEKKIQARAVANNDEILEKYNLEKITEFVKDKLGNLVQTYTDSELQEKRTLLGSIFPSGLVWGGNGYSNLQISQFYSQISAFENISGSLGTRGRNRTFGLLVRSEMLYPTELRGHKIIISNCSN